jgi:2-hydroxychromene-2-carboxylate isomerase
MAAPIDFYFDFSSPYGYLAAEKIDALAAKHERSVNWHPILLGVVFKATGSTPLPDVPLKGSYSQRDFARSAAFHGVALRMPDRFPIPTIAAARAVLWLQALDAAVARQLALALFRAYFVRNVDISTAEAVLDVAAAQGVDRSALAAALSDPAVKERLKAETEAAIARGVFGSPFVIVDGEPFWGVDRLDQVERWLATGGW